MGKLKLVAEPTFKTKVGIPVAGKDPVDVEMTFKYRTRKELQVFMAERVGGQDIEAFMAMVQGWELEEEFTRENAETFLDIYGGAAVATYRAYCGELLGARIKN